MIKIAIKGHPTKRKEVIQILESLGGINNKDWKGDARGKVYYIDKNNNIQCNNTPIDYKEYTLEEFEKEFPFKIGDRIISTTNFRGIVTNLKENGWYYVKYDNGNFVCIFRQHLKLYIEMERNITLTLDKAKEWYKKGGELKEVALQAYSEEELTKIELPKTWEEFCENYPVKLNECWMGTRNSINFCTITCKREYKNWIPSKQSAEAHLALIQLEQLRDCYRQGDIPDFTKSNNKYCIAKIKKRIDVVDSSYTSYFLSFTKKEVAEEFLTNFKHLIKIAENYI